jgi:hypothetical protein
MEYAMSENFKEETVVVMSNEPSSPAGAVVAGAGATVGAAGAVGAVAASGTVVGLGATGITSGLAAIGGVVGGGMATGLLVTVASPILAAAAAYGIYKLVKNKK